jgi:hypothetical protein
MLYRYELLKESEGFMQSLDYYDVCEDTQDELLENFNKHLAVPIIERGIETKSYFTEKAKIKFEKDILNLVAYWKLAKGVEVTEIIIPDIANSYYRDEYQVLSIANE